MMDGMDEVDGMDRILTSMGLFCGSQAYRDQGIWDTDHVESTQSERNWMEG